MTATECPICHSPCLGWLFHDWKVMEADTVDDGPSPTDAEFDAAIDGAYTALHAFRSSVYGVERSRAAQELADVLADLLALCGRSTVRLQASDVLCMALSPAGFICNREPAHDGDHVATALDGCTDDSAKCEVARWVGVSQ